MTENLPLNETGKAAVTIVKTGISIASARFGLKTIAEEGVKGGATFIPGFVNDSKDAILNISSFIAGASGQAKPSSGTSTKSSGGAGATKSSGGGAAKQKKGKQKN